MDLTFFDNFFFCAKFTTPTVTFRWLNIDWMHEKLHELRESGCQLVQEICIFYQVGIYKTDVKMMETIPFHLSISQKEKSIKRNRFFFINHE